jgi:protein-tyrosine-phosphatase
LRPKKLEEIPLKELDYVFFRAEKKCPNIPNMKNKSRAIPDPAKASGTPEEVEKVFEETLKVIEEKVLDFLRKFC